MCLWKYFVMIFQSHLSRILVVSASLALGKLGSEKALPVATSYEYTVERPSGWRREASTTL